MPNIKRFAATTTAAALVTACFFALPVSAGTHDHSESQDEIRVLVEKIKDLQGSSEGTASEAELMQLVQRLVETEMAGVMTADAVLDLDVDGDGKRVVTRVMKVKVDDGDEPTVVWMHSDSDDPHGSQVRIIGAGGESFKSEVAFLGVGFMPLNADLLQHFGVSQESGVLVSNVEEDSPAFRAGIEVGDVVTAINGDPISSRNSLSHAIASKSPGDSVDVELWRNGRVESISATLDARQGFAGLHKFEFKTDCEDGEECEQGIFVIKADGMKQIIETCADGENCGGAGGVFVVEEDGNQY